MSLYQPLQDYLSGRSEDAVVMSYSEVERLIGRALPPTAYGNNKRQWWANTESHAQALAWLKSKRKAKLDVKNQTVAFVRQPEAAALPVEDKGHLVQHELSPAARRMLDDVAEEKDISTTSASALLLNEMARYRRAATIEWFAGKSSFSDIASADLVREDRDAR